MFSHLVFTCRIFKHETICSCSGKGYWRKAKKKNSFAHVCTYLRIRIATYHNGCFCEILPENYFRPISILNTIVQQILQIKATIFSKKPLFFSRKYSLVLKIGICFKYFLDIKKVAS